jgi:ubiquitin-associated SH3 domain-containing protein
MMMPHESSTTCEYIVYACPLGRLARQLATYYVESRAVCGPNAAHQYMPHCSLTGFFHDELASIPAYTLALDAAVCQARPTRPDLVLQFSGLLLSETFHGLLIESPWLKGLATDFAASAPSATRRDDIRLKSWLHLSLAYEFPREQHHHLATLAHDLVEIDAPVSWELRFYERHLDLSWTCHAYWTL